MSQKIDKKVADKLYEILFSIHDIFTKKKLEYCMSGGTLLGALRHKGIIPWDDDADLSILNTKENIKKLLSLKKHFLKSNIGIAKTYYGFKIYDINGTPIKKNSWREHKRKFKESHPHIKGRSLISKHASRTYKKPKTILYEEYKYPFVDIFLQTMKKDKIVYLKNRWPKCYYSKKNYKPFKLYKFKSKKLYGVKNPNEYLDSCYGKDWSTHGVITYDHKTEKMLPYKKFRLSRKTKGPA